MMKGVGTSWCQLLKMWVKGCLDEVGGDWEKRRVICVDYGVWGAQVPSEPFGGVGVGGGTGLGLDISYG